jgi:ABC-type uncharacterized transport system auxiliary subunit
MRLTLIQTVRPAAALIACVLCMLCTCGTVPIKQYYVLNYVPPEFTERAQKAPYSFTLRVKQLDIEDAYSRPAIVYRQSPFELRYYFYKLWAVKPNRMITDLIFKHLSSISLVNNVVRRFDEGVRPDYELSGLIEALEEYDSDQLWFAHIAIRFTLTRVSDATVVYSRFFDNRKRVFKYSPDNVVREMSAVVEFIMNQAIRDIDEALSKEAKNGPGGAAPDTGRTPETRKLKGAGGD